MRLHPVSCVVIVSSTVDADIPKLPKYVFRRANGSYRYKRNVPKALREVIPKATVYRQLGNSYDEAIRRLPVVHAEVEALFDQERSTPNSVREKTAPRALKNCPQLVSRSEGQTHFRNRFSIIPRQAIDSEKRTLL